MASSPYRQDLQTRDQIAAALFEAAVVIKVRKKDLLKWPMDIEALHQYRIAIRVARSLVKFIKPYQKRSQNNLLKLTLKQLQDPTSRMRELDVLVPQLEEGSPVRTRCEQAQAETRRAFNTGMKSDETRNALAVVDENMRAIRWNKQTARQGISAAELAARIEAKRAYCEDTLQTVDFTNQEAVHDLRKQAKALRYVSRELVGCLPEGAGRVGTRMRDVQDKLGRWCDARVSAALVAEVCGAEGAPVSEAFQQQAQDVLEELKQDAEAARSPEDSATRNPDPSE